MDIKEILQGLGLTNSEIKLYLALLRFSPANANKLIEKSGLTTSSLHLSLNSLISKGLVNYILEGKRRSYQATPPENLVSYLEEKKEGVMQVLPELKKLQRENSSGEVATLYKGVKGIKEVYSILLDEPGSEFNSFGDSPEVAERMTYDWWANMHARRVNKKLKCRQLFDERHNREEIQVTLNRPLTKIRFLPKEYAQLQVTAIVGELVAITVFGEDPYGLLIRDRILADGYRRYFEELWKIAK